MIRLNKRPPALSRIVSELDALKRQQAETAAEIADLQPCLSSLSAILGRAFKGQL